MADATRGVCAETAAEEPATELSQTEHDAQPALRPGPQILDDVAARRARDKGDRKRNQNRVVELSRDGNEVRHQVERHQQIRDEESKYHLRSPRDSVVSKQTLEEHDAVREKARNLTSLALTSEQEQHDD
jgi:hypothetical protein